MKKTLSLVIALAVCLPCILILDGGEGAPHGEESLGWTNLVGVLWLAFLALGGFRLLTPEWVRKELESYMGEDN